MRLLTVKEAAAALAVSEGTVRGLCSARRIRHERHGLGRGVIRIPEDAVEEYRRGVTVGAGGSPPAAAPARPARPVRLRNLSLD